MRMAAFGLAGLILTTNACATLIGLEEGVPDVGGGGSPASSSSGSGGGLGGAGGASSVGGGGAGGSPKGCPVTDKGPLMISVPALDSAGGGYCIDRTEVTVSHYNEWLALSPDPADQPQICSWNADFKPASAGNDCNFYDWPNAILTDPNAPVRCADWCDAAAFCKWAGKRLCGKIGGGPVSEAELIDPASSEWYQACSQGGAKDFPYGAAYDGKACVGADYDGQPGFDPMSDYPRDVSAASGCEGGYPGIFDMSGNLREWEDACNGSMGKDDTCFARSGSYTDIDIYMRCSVAMKNVRSEGAIRIGFRCCADPN